MDFFIQTDFKDSYATPYSELFNKIDKKVHQYSKALLDNIRYGMNNEVNYDAYEDLMVYRDILNKKLYCDYCLCDFDINEIVSKIKQLSNAIC